MTHRSTAAICQFGNRGELRGRLAARLAGVLIPGIAGLAASLAGCATPESEPGDAQSRSADAPLVSNPGNPGAEGALALGARRLARLEALSQAYESRLLDESGEGLDKTSGYLEEAATILAELAEEPPVESGEREAFVRLCRDGAEALRTASRVHVDIEEARRNYATLMSYLFSIRDAVGL